MTEKLFSNALLFYKNIYEKCAMIDNYVIYFELYSIICSRCIFSLANKFMTIYNDSLSGRNWQRRISKFAQYDKDIKRLSASESVRQT